MKKRICDVLINQARKIVSGTLDLGDLKSISVEKLRSLHDAVNAMSLSSDLLLVDKNSNNADSVIYCLNALKLCKEECKRASINYPQSEFLLEVLPLAIKSVINKLEVNSSNPLYKSGSDCSSDVKAMTNNTSSPIGLAKEACGYAKDHLAKNSSYTPDFGERLASVMDQIGSVVKGTNWGDFDINKASVPNNKPSQTEVESECNGPIGVSTESVNIVKQHLMENKNLGSRFSAKLSQSIRHLGSIPPLAQTTKVVPLQKPPLSFKEFEERQQQNQALLFMSKTVKDVGIALNTLGEDFTANDLKEAEKSLSNKSSSSKELTVLTDEGVGVNKESSSIHDFISKCFEEEKEKLLKQNPTMLENIKAFFDTIKAMFAKTLPNKEINVTTNNMSTAL
jgi:hypothetical protein